MKYAFSLVGALVPFLLFGQDYVMYETNYLNVRPGKSAEFAKAMKAHNDRFHAVKPYRATVHYVVNGPRTGQFSWIMGPTTFTHLDNRPNDEAHNEDWFGNVMSLTDGAGYTEYWRLDPARSYIPDTLNHPILRVRTLKIKRGGEQRFNRLAEQINKVRVQKKYPRRASLFRNQLWHDDGHDVAFVTNFDKWAELDEEGGFTDDFEEVHGKGSWRHFLDEWNDVVESGTEEYRTRIDAMSGGNSE